MTANTRRNYTRAIGGAGGASIIAIIMMNFASKGEVEALKKRQDDTWVAVQNIQSYLMRRADATGANTNEVAHALGTGGL